MNMLTIVSVALIITSSSSICFYWNFIEIIVGLHAVVRNDSDSLYILPSFPPYNILQNYNTTIRILTLIQSTGLFQIACVCSIPFYWWPPIFAKLVSLIFSSDVVYLGLFSKCNPFHIQPGMFCICPKLEPHWFTIHPFNGLRQLSSQHYESRIVLDLDEHESPLD